MKLFAVQLALLASLVFSSSAELSERIVKRREAAMKYWAEKAKEEDPPSVRARDLVDQSMKRLESWPAKMLNPSRNAASIPEQVKIADGSAPDQSRMRRRTEELTYPYPADGQEVTVYAIGGEVYFEEDTTFDEVDCFYFDKDDDGVDISYTCDYIFHDNETLVAYVAMGGLTEGDWTWWVTNPDGVESSKQTFTLKIEPMTGDGETRIAEYEYTSGGQILGAAGRIYYSSYGVDYACSGTAIKDNKSGRTLIVTAAHCVWDDVDEIWGSNAIFIPNRDSIDTALTGADVHRQCSNDICGCWTLSAGFVLEDWKYEPWPARLAYDWGIWVADDVGAHTGTQCGGSDALDKAITPMEFEVGVDLTDVFTHGLGYTLSHNPDFRYCGDHVGFNEPTAGVDTYWLPACSLKGGASGGPWIKELDEGSGIGTLVSVNSWSFSTSPGMGGPIIDAPTGRCLVNAARDADFEAIEARPDGEEGEFINCYFRDCVDAESVGADTARRLVAQGRKLCKKDTKA